MTADEMGMAIGLSIGVLIFVVVGTFAAYFFLKTRVRYMDLAWWRLTLLAFGIIQGLLSAFGFVLLAAESFSDPDSILDWLKDLPKTAAIILVGLYATREARKKQAQTTADI